MSLNEAFNWAIKMHPNELQNMGWGWVNPLPQNGQELRKAFKDGAVGAKDNFKQGVKEHKEGFENEAKRRIESASDKIKPQFVGTIWKRILKKGHLPFFMLNEDFKQQNVPGIENMPNST